MQIDDQKSVAIVAFDGSSFDRSGKLNRLFEAAVSDLHLVVNETLTVMRVAPAAADAQHRVADFKLQLVRTDARQINLDDPTVFRLIDVGGRIPQPPGRYHPPTAADQRELTIFISHGKRISTDCTDCKSVQSVDIYQKQTQPKTRFQNEVFFEMSSSASASSRSSCVSSATSPIEIMPSR